MHSQHVCRRSRSSSPQRLISSTDFLPAQLPLHEGPGGSSTSGKAEKYSFNCECYNKFLFLSACFFCFDLSPSVHILRKNTTCVRRVCLMFLSSLWSHTSCAQVRSRHVFLSVRAVAQDQIHKKWFPSVCCTGSNSAPPPFLPRTQNLCTSQPGLSTRELQTCFS